MPGLDGTGPLGLGPRTGRGLGPCGAGVWTRPFGFGFGRGFGWRARIWGSTLTPAPAQPTASEKAALEAEKRALEAELDAIKKRLKELEKKLE